MRIRLRDESGNVHTMTEVKPKSMGQVVTDITIAALLVLVTVMGLAWA